MSSRFRGCSSFTPRPTAVGAPVELCRTEPRDGAGDASLGGSGAAGFASENRPVRCAKNDPMPAPHEGVVGFASATGSGAGAGCLEAIKLSGLIPLARATGSCGDAFGEETMLVDSRADRMLLASDFVTSTTLLEVLPTWGSETFEEELELRCIHRPRTLSTALKNPVEASVNVREIASRVGASCCSSLRSWSPSLSRRPTSANTDGRSVHGCLNRLGEQATRQ
jgi:hypothetical protein